MHIQRLGGGGGDQRKKKHILRPIVFPQYLLFSRLLNKKEEVLTELLHYENALFPNFLCATKILTEEHFKYGTKRRF